MTELFIHIYRYFRNHRAICWLSMVMLFAFFGYFASQIHLEEDINRLMPSSKDEDGTTKLAFADLKIKDKVFLLFERQWVGASAGMGQNADKLIETCDAFVDSLLAQDKDSTIGDVFCRLDDDLMPNAIDYLTEHLPAYIDTSAYTCFDTLLTREHFVQQMQQNRNDLTGEFGSMYPELIQMDPMGMRNVLARQMAPLMSVGGYTTIDGHFFVPDSTVCIAFITPQYSATNTGQGSAMFEMLNSLIDHFSKSHPDVRITYHGTPASGFYNSTQIKHDLTTTILGALLLVLMLLLFCFRRWATIPLLLLPVAFGTLFSLAIMYWIKGEFSLLALGIGGVVLGVALSYVLHVLTHHQYVSDTEQLLRDQVKPVLLGCITTIGSFAGLLFVNTDLLRDFGLFATFAILGTTLFSLVYLPQFFCHESAAAHYSSFAFIDRINDYPFDRNRPIIAVILGLTTIAICAYFLGGTHFDADMHNLGYDHPMVRHSENLLSSKTYTGDKTKYFASQGSTMEEALQRFALLDHQLDSLQHLGLVKSYTHTNQLLVPLQVQQQRINTWNKYWNVERLQTVRRLINETAPQADIRPEAFEPFFEAATASYQPDALYMAGIIPHGYLSTLTEQSRSGDYLVFSAVRCANDSVRSSDSDYIRICDAVSSAPRLLVLDTYYYTTDTLLQMSRDFNVLQWLSMAFVFFVLLLSFRFRSATGNILWGKNLTYALIAFAPILLSWLIVLGAMNLFAVRFNLISIIISTFIFGIGVDYSIFIMHGLLNDARPTLNYHKTAVILSAIILLVTVSSMLVAQHPAIRSVGFSTLIGLLSAVVLSYVLQPTVFRWLKQHKR